MQKSRAGAITATNPCPSLATLLDGASISKEALTTLGIRAGRTVAESTKPGPSLWKRSAKARTFALDYRPARAYHRSQHPIFVLSPTPLR
jgi:hypothetical protein